MPKINPYIAQEQASGTTRVQSSADMLGAGIGQSVERLGEAVNEFGRKQYQLEDDQAKLWAATATAQTEVDLRDQMRQHINSLDPTAQDYPEQIQNLTATTQQATDAATDALMSQASTKRAERYVAFHMASAKTRMTENAMVEQANLNAGYTGQIVNNGVKANTDVLAGDPRNETYTDLVNRTSATIGALDSIDPATKLKWIDSAQSTYANVQMASLVSRDPQGFLQQVNAAGGYTTRRGAPGGQVPTAGGPGSAPDGSTGATVQPDMLAFANQQLASGATPEAALQAASAQFKPGNGFAFALSPDGKSFVDNGQPASNAGDPQVEPLAEGAIASANPSISGWGKLTWPEKVKYVRQAEAQIGKDLASQRGQSKVEVQDALASFEAGQDYPGFNNLMAKLPTLYGPDEAKRVGDQLTTARDVGQFISKVGDMPTAQAASWLQQQAPQGGDEFAVKAPLYAKAMDAYKVVQKQQQAAPVQYAIQHGIASAQPLDFSDPQAFANGLRGRVAVNATMTRDYNTPSQIFTEGETEQLAQGVSKLNAKDAVSYLQGIRTSLGSNSDFATAMNQLAPKNPSLAYAANLAAKGGNAYVAGQPVAAQDVAAKIVDGDRILNGRTIDKQEGKGLEPTMPTGSKATNFDESTFRQMFDTAVGAQSFQSPDATRSAAMETEVFNAVKAYYAADSYAQGKPLSSIDKPTFQRAVDAVTGGVWDRGQNGGKIFAPFGMDMPTFQDQFPQRLQQTLKANGFDDTTIKYGADRLKAVNLADGKYGFLNGDGRMLVNPQTGRTIVMDYGQPYVETRRGFAGGAIQKPEDFNATVINAANGVLQ